MVSTKSRCFSLFVCGCFVVFFSFVPVSFSNAQSLSSFQKSTMLVANPERPAPYSNVSISLDAYSVNTLGSTILWYVDGIEVVGSKNERSISFVAGGIGTKHTVRVVVTSPTQPRIETSISIPINAVDLVIEADTYTPAFYHGRALPSENASIRAIAIPLTKSVGTPLEYTYEWKLDGNVLLGGPIRGKQVLETKVPQFGKHRLSVTVFDKTNAQIGTKGVDFTPVEPELYFYEENPLRGLSRKAVTKDFTLVGDETTVFAEPYFMNTTLAETEGTFEWRLNGSLVNPVREKPNSITLRHTGGEGSANIEFMFVTHSIPFQYVQKAFDIFFR